MIFRNVGSYLSVGMASYPKIPELAVHVYVYMCFLCVFVFIQHCYFYFSVLLSFFKLSIQFSYGHPAFFKLHNKIIIIIIIIVVFTHLKFLYEIFIFWVFVKLLDLRHVVI